FTLIQYDAMSEIKDAIRCGACDTENTGESDFCSGCGHHLTESCLKCGATVLLTQKFCAKCGEDLQKHIKKNSERFQSYLVEAVSAAKQHRYDDALAQLARVTAKPDYRHAGVQKDAAIAAEKVRELSRNAARTAFLKAEQSVKAFENRDYAKVIELLDPLPTTLLADEEVARLRAAKNLHAELTELQQETRNAILGKDWLVASSALGRLIQLDPDNKSFQKHSRDVGEKIIAVARKLIADGSAGKAVSYLSSLPEVSRNKDSEKLLAMAEDVVWIRQQFDRQPFATPLLGRLAVRLQREAPKHPEATKILATLTKLIENTSNDPRCHWSRMALDCQSLLGGPLNFLVRPSCVDWSAVEFKEESWMTTHVALGLALTGLSQGPLTMPLWTRKSGLAGVFRKRKPDSVWGIDFGASAIHAVRVRRSGDAFEVTDVYHHRFVKPLSSIQSRADRLSKLRDEVVALLRKVDLRDDPVWASRPNVDTVNHFIRLPPVQEKQAKKLLEKEAEARIPLKLEDIAMTTWMPDDLSADAAGIPAMVTGTRKTELENLMELLATVGLPVAAVVSEGSALINFACVEFAEEISKFSEPGDCIALVDCGGESTTTALVGNQEYWHGTVEIAGEQWTRALARAGKDKREIAEQKKRDISKLEHPAAVWPMVDEEMRKLSSRVEMQWEDAKKHCEHWNPHGTWICGGGARVHNFAKHALQAEA
ncbi:MAG: pilus assembly protein PilM, partial [Planctomycetota bacterium]